MVVVVVVVVVAVVAVLVVVTMVAMVVVTVVIVVVVAVVAVIVVVVVVVALIAAALREGDRDRDRDGRRRLATIELVVARRATVRSVPVVASSSSLFTTPSPPLPPLPPPPLRDRRRSKNAPNPAAVVRALRLSSLPFRESRRSPSSGSAVPFVSARSCSFSRSSNGCPVHTHARARTYVRPACLARPIHVALIDVSFSFCSHGKPSRTLSPVSTSSSPFLPFSFLPAVYPLVSIIVTTAMTTATLHSANFSPRIELDCMRVSAIRATYATLTSDRTLQLLVSLLIFTTRGTITITHRTSSTLHSPGE